MFKRKIVIQCIHDDQRLTAHSSFLIKTSKHWSETTKSAILWTWIVHFPTASRPMTARQRSRVTVYTLRWPISELLPVKCHQHTSTHNAPLINGGAEHQLTACHSLFIAGGHLGDTGCHWDWPLLTTANCSDHGQTHCLLCRHGE